MSLEPGTRFGAYQVVEPIGAGGMGEVYRATDTNLKRDVALKVLPQAFVEDADRLARFQREAEILASLNHPNIAQVHGLEKSDGQTAIVMELVDGPTLADRIKGGPIPPDEAMAIALQVIAALEAAHDKSIVHRDLKPANVKVKDDGTVKVLDFGISKPIDASAISGGSPVMTTPAVTETGVILGTAAYMSPEQARGRFVDQRTDIWAFGCLLFELLTGQPAFGGEDVMLTLARVLDRDTDLSSIPATISPVVRHTIRLCLEKDPHKRIHHIGDVRLALEGAFDTSYPIVPEAQARRPLRRLAVPVAATAVVVAVLAVLVTTWLAEPEPPSVRRSVHRLAAGQNLNLPIVPAIDVSPDGSTIVYAADDALYRRPLNELEGRLIPGTEGQVAAGPVFSPDGQWLLYGSATENRLKRVPIDGGTPLPILSSVPGPGWRWSRDETILYPAQCRIFAIAPTGGEPEQLAEEADMACVEPTLLPGDDYLIYERRPPDQVGQNEIVAKSIETGEVTALFPGRQPTYLEPYLIYFDATLGLMARRFDPDTLETGAALAFVDDIMQADPQTLAQFRVAANGTLVYVQGDASNATGGLPLSIVDRDGNLSQLAAPFYDYSFPSVSPSGDRVAVEVSGDSSSNIFVYDLGGGSEIRQLTFEGNNTRPAWSRDGEWVVFASDRDGRTRIWRKRANGRFDAEPLTDPAEGYFHDTAAFTSDGERLAYSETEESTDAEDIWIMTMPDGEPELLVGGPGAQFAIAFSPDGAAMAYASFLPAEGIRLFVEPYPKENGSGLRVSADGVNTGWPVWSRDSRTLSYQLYGRGGFGAIDIDTSDFSVSNRRELGIVGGPNERRADSLPGGGDLLITVPAFGPNASTSDVVSLIIVENWIEEVKDRLP